MNCIWLLLILCCSGCNNNWGNNWSDNRCCDNGSNWGSGNTWGCNHNYCSNCNACDRVSNKREAIKDAICDAVCDNAYSREDDDCNCRRAYNFPNYPVLDKCD